MTAAKAADSDARATPSGLGLDEDVSLEALVLGIGNILWADEGFGVRCIEAMDRDFDMPAAVRLLDGGTQGLYLVNEIARARRVIVFDAIDWGDPPGSLRLVRGEEVPHFPGLRKMSLHQSGFQDVMAAAGLMGRTPEDILLIGVQAVQLEDFGGSLTDLVRAQIEPAVEIAAAELSAWGFAPRRRDCPRPATLIGDELALGRYEEQRPDAAAACRFGDDRFFAAAAD